MLTLLSFSISANDELQSYIDGVIESTMNDHSIVGLTLAVVAEGEVKALKGYGYADLKSHTPVDPAKHLFRIASITKTLTSTAIMQLVEQGKIDLNADVNEYLTAFKIPEAFAAPVRVKDLLSHRAGFEEVYHNLWVEHPGDFATLESWLSNNIPKRVFAPGTVTNYSNYGGSLAGYIVQEVSGMTYTDYVEAFVLKPLAMNSTTIKQMLGDNHPLNMPKPLQERLATVYKLKDAKHQETPFELLSAVPGGSISSTAADMSRFMLAHLNNGELDGVQILKRNTALQMRERPYPGRPGPDLSHGFRTGKIAGYATLEHDGTTFTSFSSMKMIPKLGLGVFISVNGSDASRAQGPAAVLILKKMIERFVPRPPIITMSTEQAKVFTGDYMTNRRVYSHAYKLFHLSGGGSSVVASPENSLTITRGSKTKRYERIGPRSFQQQGGDDVVVFELDGQNQALRYYSAYGHQAHDRLALHTNPQLFWLALALGGIGSLTWLVIVWKYRQKAIHTTGEKCALWASVAAAVIALFCAGEIVAFYYNIVSLTMIYFVQISAAVLALISVLAILGGILILKGNSLALAGKSFYVLLMLLLFNMINNLFYWRVLGALLQL